MALNSSIFNHGYSPHFLVFGREMTYPSEFLLGKETIAKDIPSYVQEVMVTLHSVH